MRAGRQPLDRPSRGRRRGTWTWRQIAGARRQADREALIGRNVRLIAGLVTLLSVLGFATGVSAHASLIWAEPGDGSMLSQAPKTVRLHFNEPVSPASIKLIDGTGRARED